MRNFQLVIISLHVRHKNRPTYDNENTPYTEDQIIDLILQRKIILITK